MDNFETLFYKRYSGNRYEYMYFISFKIDWDKLDVNQGRKRDIMILMRKHNGILFNSDNETNQWFFSKNTCVVDKNNTQMSIDHLRNMFHYISPLPGNITIYFDANTFEKQDDEINKDDEIKFTSNKYKLYTLRDAKIVKKGGEEIKDHNLKNYFVCVLPQNKELSFSISTEFNKPYAIDDNYDLDAQQEIKSIILFDVIDPTLKVENPAQTFLYVDNVFDKAKLEMNYGHTADKCYKFRKPHVKFIVPEYDKKKYLYDIMKISKSDVETYNKRIKDDDELNYIKVSKDENIIIGYSLIGSSEYLPTYFSNILSNVRRKIGKYTFYDKEFITRVLTNSINNINHYIKNK